MNRRTPALLAGLFSLALSAVASASVTPFERLVTQLNDDQLAVREQATRTLIETPTLTLKEIEGSLKSSTLSAEQRTRLHVIAEAVFTRTERGALGVSWDIRNPAQPGARGVVVGGCIKGFSAEQLLKPGDIILAIDSARVENATFDRSDITYEILSHDPGDEIRVTLLRAGEKLQVTCSIGRYSDLPNLGLGAARGSAPDSSMISGAWKRRLARLEALAPETKPLATPLLRDGWRKSNEEISKADHLTAVEYARIARASGLDPDRIDVSIVVPSLVAAGQSRGNPAASATEDDIRQARGEQVFRVPDGFGRRGRRIDMKQVNDLQAALNRTAIQLQVDMQLLSQPNLDPAQRQAAEKRRADGMAQIDRIQRQLMRAANAGALDQ